MTDVPTYTVLVRRRDGTQVEHLAADLTRTLNATLLAADDELVSVTITPTRKETHG